jgi:hypothetical protein
MQTKDEGNLQPAVTQPGDDFLVGEVLKLHACFGHRGMQGTKRVRQDARGRRRRVAHMQLGNSGQSDGPRLFYGFVGPPKEVARFFQKNMTCLREAQRLRRALEKKNADLSLQVANLSAQSGLRAIYGASRRRERRFPLRLPRRNNGDEAVPFRSASITDSYAGYRRPPFDNRWSYHSRTTARNWHAAGATISRSLLVPSASRLPETTRTKCPLRFA